MEGSQSLLVLVGWLACVAVGVPRESWLNGIDVMLGGSEGSITGAECVHVLFLTPSALP